MSIKTIKVKLWGSTIGYLHEQTNGLISFQYDADFISSGIEVPPLKCHCLPQHTPSLP